MFWLFEDEVFINCMGFNNGGMVVMYVWFVVLIDWVVLVWVNIGKNKVIFNEDVVEDYCKCVWVLGDLVDVFVVNVSSFNILGLWVL